MALRELQVALEGMQELVQELNRAKEIAETTVLYLGGFGRIRAMIGAHDFVCHKNGTLSFHFKGCRKANLVEFALNGNDLYDVRFYRVTRSSELKAVSCYEDMYCDEIKSLFEAETGLYLSL